MGSEDPVKIECIRGTVHAGDYARGTKSERPAVFIETGQGRHLLRRKDGPAFGDDKLDKYVGQEVECDGFLMGTTLLATRIDVVGKVGRPSGRK